MQFRHSIFCPFFKWICATTVCCVCVWNMCLPCSSLFPCPFLYAGVFIHDHGFWRNWSPSRGVQTAFGSLKSLHPQVPRSLPNRLHADDAEAYWVYWWKDWQVLSCREGGVRSWLDQPEKLTRLGSIWGRIVWSVALPRNLGLRNFSRAAGLAPKTHRPFVQLQKKSLHKFP